LWASNSGNNGDGDGDGVKDTAACTKTGERGLMMTMGHGLCVSICVSGEAMKNKAGPEKGMAAWNMDCSEVSDR
jgi:hypothetical protein